MTIPFDNDSKAKCPLGIPPSVFVGPKGQLLYLADWVEIPICVYPSGVPVSPGFIQ